MEICCEQLTDSAAPEATSRQSYALYEAIETPNTFIFVVEWTSLDGLYAHFTRPHFTDFPGALGEVLAEPPVGTIPEASSTIPLDEGSVAAEIGG